MDDRDELREQIQRTYAKIAVSGSTGGCCSGSCSCNGYPMDVSESSIRIGYID